MTERCAVDGCDQTPVVRVRLASDDGVFDLVLCELDREWLSEANLGVLSGESEL